MVTDGIEVFNHHGFVWTYVNKDDYKYSHSYDEYGKLQVERVYENGRIEVEAVYCIPYTFRYLTI